MTTFENTSRKKKKYPIVFIWILFLSSLFFACKRSNSQHLHREYDTKLVQTLNKLKQKYANKKVRVNTWKKKENAYQDIIILDEEGLPSKQTLTIGDSVQLLSIDLNQTDGIRAKIKSKTNLTGYIPYQNVEEFEPATTVDPDLRD